MFEEKNELRASAAQLIDLKPTLTTQEAAMVLNLTPQRLRVWASRQCGPIVPVKVGGRLHWRAEDIKRVLGL